MKKLTIFTWIRDKWGKPIKKNILRIINVRPVFQGISETGTTIHSEFKALAKALEPHSDGYDVIDI